MNKEIGYLEGEVCNRKGCKGIITEHERRGCSCHINPPCGSCTEPRAYCPECEWEEKDTVEINDFLVQVDRTTGFFKSWVQRPLDNTKIDWYSYGHTNSSMKKVGVYPEGTTMSEVLSKVKGTFGGRFTYFGNGKFEYIAYTD